MTTTTAAANDTAGCEPVGSALSANTGPLKRVVALTATVMIVEVIGGLAANSLALLADAGHMLTDVGAVGLALFAAWIAQRDSPPEKTYGYLRFEVLAALVNGAALFVIAGGIVWEAVRRLRAPEPLNPTILLGVATIGLVANLIAMRILHGGHRHSLNVRGAYLHVVSDMLGSVGAILAGAVILLTGWLAADTVVSLLVAGLILVSGWRLVRESVDVLLESTPAHIDLDLVSRRIAEIPGVAGVHDLHVWTVTSGMIAMSGHAIVDDPHANQRVLEAVQRRMADLGIHHVTMQIERDPTCEPATDRAASA